MPTRYMTRIHMKCTRCMQTLDMHTMYVNTRYIHVCEHQILSSPHRLPRHPLVYICDMHTLHTHHSVFRATQMNHNVDPVPCTLHTAHQPTHPPTHTHTQTHQMNHYVDLVPCTQHACVCVCVYVCMMYAWVRMHV